MALNVGELYASFSIDSSGVSGSLNDITKQCNSIASDLTKTGAVMSAAVTAPLVKMAKGAYDAGTGFEAQMSKVGAVSGATATELQALTDKALYMGSTTQWTASQAGEALEYMGMAGWDASTMMAALPAVMNLATAAGADLGTTSDIVTDAMTAFGITMQNAGNNADLFASQTVHFTDVIAAAAASSNTSVELLGTSFTYVAPLAGTLGMKADDVAVALGLMANAGIKGTMSGAALRNILNGLMGTSKSTAEACETLGVSLYAADGSALSMKEVMQELRDSYKDNQEEATAMQKAVAELDAKLEKGEITEKQYESQLDKLTEGSSDFMAACVKLAGKQGLSGLLAIMSASDEDFNNLTAAIDGCDGKAQEMADTMLKNAAGAVTIFQSAVEGLQITLWNLLSESFIDVVKTATDMVQSFTQMDSATQIAALKFAALAAAAGPAMLALGRIVNFLPKIVPMLTSLISPLGIVAGGLALFAVAAVDAENNIGKMLVSISQSAKKRLSEFNKTIQSSIKAISARMPALIKSVITGINNVLPELMIAFTSIFTEMMNMFSDNASGIAEIGTTIITSIVNGLADGMPQMIPAAANMVTSIANAIIGNLPVIISAVGNLLESIVTGFISTDWAGLGQSILNSIGSAFTSVATLFAEWFGGAKDGVENINWADVGQTIISSIFSDVNVGVTKLNTFLSDMFTSATTSLSTALSGESANNVRTAIVGMLTSVIEGAGNLLPTLGNTATILINGITGLLNSIPWDNISTDAASLGESIIGLIVKGIESASGVAVSLVNAIGSLFTAEGAGTQILSGATDIAISILTAIAEAIPTISNSAVDIINAVSNLIGSISWDNVAVDVSSMASKLIEGIVTALSSAIDGATNIANAISSLFANIDWTKVADAASSIAGSLFSGLIEGVKTLTPDMSEFISAIGRGVSAACEGLGTVAGTLIGNLVIALITPENWLKLIEVGGKLVDGIANGIIGLGKGILEGAWSFVSGTLTGLFKALGFQTWSEETEAAMSSMVEVINTEGELIGASMDAVYRRLTTPTINEGVSSMETLQSYISAYNAVLQSGTEEMIASIGNAKLFGNAEVVSLFEKLVGDTANESQKAAALIALNSLGLGDFISREFKYAHPLIDASAREMTSGAVDTFITAFEQLGYVIPDTVKAGLEAGTITVEDAAAQVVEAASTANDQATAEAAASATGTAVTDELADAEETGTTTVTTATEGIVTAQEVALETFPGIASDTATEATNGMADAITNNESTVTTAMDNLSSEVVEKAIAQMNYADGFTIGSSWVNGIKNGIASVAENIRSVAASMASDVKTSVTSEFSDAMTIGYNFSSGLAQGIRNGRSAVVSAAIAVANAAVSASKSALKEKSPSRLARDEIGYNYSAGLALGVLDGESEVINAAKGVSNSLHESFLVSDPSRSTVMTSRETVSATAKEVAGATTNGREDYESLGDAIASALVNSGVLNRVIMMDKKIVGEEVAGAVSKKISSNAKSTLSGRSVQGVLV